MDGIHVELLDADITALTDTPHHCFSEVWLQDSPKRRYREMWKLTGYLFLCLLLQIVGQGVDSKLPGLKQGRRMIEQIFVVRNIVEQECK